MNTTHLRKLAAILPALLAGCSGSGSRDLASFGRVQDVHQELSVVDPNATSSSVSAQAVSIGSIYLESSIAPPTVAGTSLQASDVSANGTDVYVSYSSVDTPTEIIKKGQVEHIVPYNCDNPSTTNHTEFCLNAVNAMVFPNADIFSSFSDGTNLYAVGSTSDESVENKYGRLYKISLDLLKNPSAVTATLPLPGFAGTAVSSVGGRVFATSGTSQDSLTTMGGLSVFNAADMGQLGFTSMYDARGLSFMPQPLLGPVPTDIYVIRGANTVNPASSSVAKVSVAGTGSVTSSTNIIGNTAAESKSGLSVGSQTMLVSNGSAGFSLLCKATGALIQNVPVPNDATGVPMTGVVTNSVAAVPGYIFAADGEAGIYVYSFKKLSALTSNFCGTTTTLGVTKPNVSVTYLGRLSLTSGSYVANALSANSVSAVTFLNLANLVTARMLVVGAGNKGTYLINVTNISLTLTDVDDGY